MTEKFDKYYFTSLNYVDYLQRYDRYRKLAKETVDLLESLSLIKKEATHLYPILDYGCAVGFLCRALDELGYKNCGYDISEWAINQASLHDVNIIEDFTADSEFFPVTYCLDVLEHMTDRDISSLLDVKLNTRALIVRIPVSVDGENFHLEVSRKDPTHINCKTTADWEDFLYEFGYQTILPLNLYTIYDSPGVFSALCIKS